MFSESHCHLRRLNNDELEKTIGKAEKASIELILAAGTTFAISKKEIQNARKYPILKACIGIHPWNADLYSEKTRRELKELVIDEEVVAVDQPIAVGIASAVGVASTIAVVVRAAGEAASGPLAGFGSRVVTGLSSFMGSLMTMPGVPTAWSEDPGIAGIAWGLAIVLFAFAAVSLYRFSRQLAVEWR